MEYDWMVKSGSDPGKIRFKYLSVKASTVDRQGNLIIKTRFGELVHKKPVCYQVINGKKVRVESKFKKMGRNAYGFTVQQYAKDYELIIEPVVTSKYSTYLGGSGDDIGNGITVDKAGYIYVTGGTDSVDFPTKNAFQGAISDNRDAYVSKFNPEASDLVFSTYLGVSGYEVAYGLAVDVSGNAYVSGITNSNDFPIHNATASGSGNVFVTKFFGNGLSLAYSTYFGGAMAAYNRDIALDTSYSALVTGFPWSNNFPLERAYQDSFGGGRYDAFISKLSIIYDVEDLLNLTVQSTPETRIPIHVTPRDINAQRNGKTNFERSFNIGTKVWLTAPGAFKGKKFHKWSIDGTDNFNRKIAVTMDKDHKVTSQYKRKKGQILSFLTNNFSDML